jgi:hypothetical protein
MENLIERLRQLDRVEVSVCDCHLGAHLEVAASSNGEFVRWEDIEALLKGG